MMTVGSVLSMKAGESQAKDVEKVQIALSQIVMNRREKALNYAVNYASLGYDMAGNLLAQRGILSQMDPEAFHEFYVQLLYVANNLSYWRGDTAKQVRTTIKDFIKKYQKSQRR